MLDLSPKSKEEEATLSRSDLKTGNWTMKTQTPPEQWRS